MILVAEDEPLSQALISAMLKRLGHQHHVVANGAEAVAFVAAAPCGLVLMDLQMPGMGGIEAALAIRALDGASSRVPILFVSGDPVGLAKARLAVPDACGTLGKPYRVQDLDLAIRTNARSGAAMA